MLGKGTIIHPGAKIQALGGPIVIGEYNIIEEKTIIKNWYKMIKKISKFFKLYQ